MNVRFAFFWSSYTPLFLLFALRFTSDGLRGTMAALSLGGVIALVISLYRGRGAEPKPHELVSVSDEGAALSAYLVAYVLPFLAAPNPPTRDLVADAVFLVLLAVMYVGTPLGQVNPLLYLLGKRVYAVRTSSGREVYLVSDRVPYAGDRVYAVPLSDAVISATTWHRSAIPTPASR